MVLIMAVLRAYCFDTHWDILMVKGLALMKAPSWNYLVVKCLEVYLEMYMESHGIY